MKSCYYNIFLAFGSRDRLVKKAYFFMLKFDISTLFVMSSAIGGPKSGYRY